MYDDYLTLRSALSTYVVLTVMRRVDQGYAENDGMDIALTSLTLPLLPHLATHTHNLRMLRTAHHAPSLVSSFSRYALSLVLSTLAPCHYSARIS